eukprot:jgi/Mesvir1/18116/Mv09413-RA.1
MLPDMSIPGLGESRVKEVALPVTVPEGSECCTFVSVATLCRLFAIAKADGHELALHGSGNLLLPVSVNRGQDIGFFVPLGRYTIWRIEPASGGQSPEGIRGFSQLRGLTLALVPQPPPTTSTPPDHGHTGHTRHQLSPLEMVANIPTLGVDTLSRLPIITRVQLRQSRLLRAAVDESLLRVTEIFAEDPPVHFAFRERRADMVHARVRDALVFLAGKCPDLTTLSTVTRQTREAECQPDCWDWMSLIECGERLDWTKPVWCLNDRTLATVAAKCPRLRHVDVRVAFFHDDGNMLNCLPGQVSDAGIIALAENCPDLRYLNAVGLPVTDKAVAELATHCPNLETLMIGKTSEVDYITERTRGAGVTSLGISLLAQGCPRLKKLDVAGWGMEDCALRALEGCRELEYLDISGSTDISDDGLLNFLESASHLQTLNLSGCIGITDASVEVLVEIDRNEMRELYLSGCSKMTDAGIAVIAASCPELRRLRLNRCGVTDSSVMAVARHCPQLDCLDLGGCSAITDASISRLARRCPALQQLGLAFCRSLTDASLKVVAQRCARLSVLNVYCCEQVTSQSLDLLRAAGCSIFAVRNSFRTYSDESEYSDD